MKINKILAAVLAAILILSLAGCKNNNKKPVETESAVPAETTEFTDVTSASKTEIAETPEIINSAENLYCISGYMLSNGKLKQIQLQKLTMSDFGFFVYARDDEGSAIMYNISDVDNLPLEIINIKSFIYLKCDIVKTKDGDGIKNWEIIDATTLQNLKQINVDALTQKYVPQTQASNLRLKIDSSGQQYASLAELDTNTRYHIDSSENFSIEVEPGDSAMIFYKEDNSESYIGQVCVGTTSETIYVELENAWRNRGAEFFVVKNDKLTVQFANFDDLVFVSQMNSSGEFNQTFYDYIYNDTNKTVTFTDNNGTFTMAPHQIVKENWVYEPVCK